MEICRGEQASRPVVLDDVVAAVAVLRDPALPGEPLGVAAIAAVLPLLADGPGSLPVEADSLRWLCAADEGALPPE
ncbi:hypothetical protein ACGFX7_05950 [Streptomyces harbinensis]|uniref:hypothetical protein n=1 Tax=Streptomyces harbinensis TaxID=1176198 RepID=UPI00371B3EC3